MCCTRVVDCRRTKEKFEGQGLEEEEEEEYWAGRGVGELTWRSTEGRATSGGFLTASSACLMSPHFKVFMRFGAGLSVLISHD